MQELDGTGVYERADWPLSLDTAAAAAAAAGAGAGALKEPRRKRGRQCLEPAELHDGRVDEGAVFRRLEDISPTMAILADGDYITDPEVSDMDDDDDDDDDERDLDSIRTPSPPRSSQHQHQPRSLQLPLPHPYSSGGNNGRSSRSSTRSRSRRKTSRRRRRSSSDSSQDSRQHRSPLQGDRRQQDAEVSPVREESVAGSRGVVPNSTIAEQELGEQDSAAPDHITQLQHHDHNDDDEEEEEEADEDHESELYESRDIARPLSYVPSSPGLQQGPSPNTSPHLSLNRATFSALTGSDPESHPRSTVRESMHSPDWRLSKRTSMYNTTQLPHQKERVRYSWQSLQDDEPHRPRIHVIKLFSQSVTAAAGFPTGEAFGFSISAGARRIAAYNSARLYVLQTNALPVGISQDYALKRRPLDVDLTDEGNTLAILADGHTINVYELGHELRRTKTITLDFPTHCITLAPSGGILAAAYEGGIEVFSLHPNALPTDRRAVRCARMDRLMFSDDGSTLLGTTTRINASATVTVSVPVFPARPDGHPTHEELKEAWCSGLLHPENIRNSSHATFMRESRTTCNDKVFAWNGLEDTFGILNVSDMNYGMVDFPVVISPPLSTCGGLGAAIHSCPSINEHGETVAMIVNDRTVRLYVVPAETEEDYLEAHSIDHELDEGYGCPFSEVRWVHSSASLPAPRNSQSQIQGRLIVTSPGGVTEPGMSDASVEEIEGGRIILFDFDAQFAGQPGQTFNLTLGKSPPVTLDEENKSMHEQVNLVRRRTVNQSKSSALNQRPTTLGRSATMHGNRSNRRTGPMPPGAVRKPNRNSVLSIGSTQSDATKSLPDLHEGTEAGDEVLEVPYVQGQPRSHASLQRAATNAQRHRFQALEERTQANVSADSSSGFLALPEYTEEPNAPLPSRFRAMAGLDAPSMFSRPKSAVVISVDGGTASQSITAGSSSQAPHTAPPHVGENFSADVAFRAANASNYLGAELRQTEAERERRELRRIEIEQEGMDSAEAQRPHSPALSTQSSVRSCLTRMEGRQQARLEHLPRGAGTSSTSSTNSARSYSPVPLSAVSAYGGSFDAMPRGLQRAYSNAVSPLGPARSSALTGDWQNISPVNRPTTSTTGHLEDEDAISPISAYQHLPVDRRFSSSNLNRFSTPTRAVVRPRTATAATMPEASSAPVAMMPARRLPPHVQTFRNAAAAAAATSASSTLFPPGQPRDHVPLRTASTRSGAAGHPITAWHPPAPSSPPPDSVNSKDGMVHGHGHGHVKNNSSGDKSSHSPSIERAKKSGRFRKHQKSDPFAPRGHTVEQWGKEEEASMNSVMNWDSKKAERCSVM